jgi:hypothetical protein
MRIFPIVALGLSALLVTACITFSAEPTLTPTPTPTPLPTEPPMITPAPTPPRTMAPGETPKPTPIELLPFLTAGVTILNLGDSTLYVTATGIDTDADPNASPGASDFELGTYLIEPEQFTHQAAIPLRIRFDFSFDEASTAGLATCTLDVTDDDEITFVAVAGGIAVSRNGIEPASVSDMNLATSSLCQVGAPQ